ncbi:PRTRC genetic system protein B [Chryseobacterium sp. H1D6B]|uniref:PRTRC system protein B n=1 Tax=Chryseobacterium sp. H1D6B TaxID=2940588 RepID=UPI0015C9A2ED|nr:PRTRC system protein B [Chryseobacterium sp. H1D6B]MDH6252489.1 PRTRC genetic system protein B [Chryseobacterium sp. H1D6B]
MENITHNFGVLYHPISALLFYQNTDRNKDMYVEHFDMDKDGNPINAHPLTIREAKFLSKALHIETEKNKEFLKPQHILSENILHINLSDNGSVIWYSKGQKVNLFFSETLGIPNGMAQVPALLWFANKENLFIFALSSDRRPTEKTMLYHAPFFNVYDSGNVCMGTVDVNIKNSASIEEFTQAWENYFFNSYFSHLMNGHNPVKGNCVNLWKDLINTGNPFPKKLLKNTQKNLKNILP